ncbi:unnamed protein product [Phytomonas sp. Hart1]|nr:unnamed protein product [Phytomonas sp. Hart1]|eukprot:CCW67560.1 unnamed protein product [Phytomonas sp. isolate Hart1]
MRLPLPFHVSPWGDGIGWEVVQLRLQGAGAALLAVVGIQPKQHLPARSLLREEGLAEFGFGGFVVLPGDPVGRLLPRRRRRPGRGFQADRGPPHHLELHPVR